MQRTLVMLKPDAVHRGLVGRLIARLEDKGLKIVALKMGRIDRATAERHYAEHEGKDFYEPLLRFVTAGPTVFMVLEGQGAVAVVRKMAGATFGPDADPGTVRGDFGMSERFNLVHGSDSAASAEKEIALFFREDELLDWDPATWPWHYDFSTGEAV